MSIFSFPSLRALPLRGRPRRRAVPARSGSPGAPSRAAGLAAVHANVGTGRNESHAAARPSRGLPLAGPRVGRRPTGPPGGAVAGGIRRGALESVGPARDASGSGPHGSALRSGSALCKAVGRASWEAVRRPFDPDPSRFAVNGLARTVAQEVRDATPMAASPLPGRFPDALQRNVIAGPDRWAGRAVRGAPATRRPRPQGRR